MTAYENALSVRTELAVDQTLIAQLKMGDPQAFERLNLNFEKIYASSDESHDQKICAICSIVPTSSTTTAN